jgi:hypothetical protein
MVSKELYKNPMQRRVTDLTDCWKNFVLPLFQNTLKLHFLATLLYLILTVRYPPTQARSFSGFTRRRFVSSCVRPACTCPSIGPESHSCACARERERETECVYFFCAKRATVSAFQTPAAGHVRRNEPASVPAWPCGSSPVITTDVPVRLALLFSVQSRKISPFWNIRSFSFF